MNNEDRKLEEGSDMVVPLGMGGEEVNEGSGVCVVCLVDIRGEKGWNEGRNGLVGIRGIMKWGGGDYERE